MVLCPPFRRNKRSFNLANVPPSKQVPPSSRRISSSTVVLPPRLPPPTSRNTPLVIPDVNVNQNGLPQNTSISTSILDPGPSNGQTPKKISDVSALSEPPVISDVNVNQNGLPQKTSISTSILDPGPSNGQTSKKISDVSALSEDSEILPEIDSGNGSNSKSTRGSDASEISEAPRRKRGILQPLVPFESARSTEAELTKYEKDEQSIEQIKTAIMSNDFVKNMMDEERLRVVAHAMSPKDYAEGSLIIREGERGSHLFISAYGQFEVTKGGQVINKFGAGHVFGELAILYKAKRFASVTCVTEAKVWMLERRVFQKIMVTSGRQEHEDNMRFLSSVPLLKGIDPMVLGELSEFLKREFFSAGTQVVRQGDRGDKFYIIRGGKVMVTKRDGNEAEQYVGTLGRGEFFGEQALLHEDRRLATVTAQPPGVECLTLDRGPFTKLLGDLEELKKRYTKPRRSTDPPKFKSEYGYVELKDLDIVGTMGVGGFGRVELVQYRPNPSLTFALKCLKKIEMVQQQQQEHVFNEKHIMVACNSPFICRLYRTFKDDKYIYFLMEAVMGGDVWTILQKRHFFPENVARFMAACVVEAFHYLHSRNIVYRDLKPENLMLDKNGYIKLVDFGFAKELKNNNKTWTFAGTPEYVAPEIVLNKGHDRAVDCWALGIFIHELLVGSPPFRVKGGDHMKTYTMILRGIDSVIFHSSVSKNAQYLIRKLCRAVPAERLGYLKNGISDIKEHKWFHKFDWTALHEGRLKAPLIQPVANNLDLSNFEKYPKDKMPPDETSGWDDNF